MAVPVRAMKRLNKSKIKKIGVSHHFLLLIKKSPNSIKTLGCLELDLSRNVAGSVFFCCLEVTKLILFKVAGFVGRFVSRSPIRYRLLSGMGNGNRFVFEFKSIEEQADGENAEVVNQ